MTEVSKKRMEEKKQQDMFTFKHGVWPETISEQVRLRDADFACLGFKAGFEAGYQAGMQDPDAQKELLEEVEKALTKAISWHQNRGNTPHGIDEFPALLQKLRAVRGESKC